MTGPRCRSAIIIVATAIALSASVSSLAIAQTQDTAHTTIKNESIFIDGKVLTISNRTSENDVTPHIARLGTHDIGPRAQRLFGGLNDDRLNGDRQRSYCAGMNALQQPHAATYDPDYRNNKLNEPLDIVSGKNAATAAEEK